MDWDAKLRWAEAEHAARTERAVAQDEREDFRLAGIAGASWAAGLAAAMLGRTDESRVLLLRAADEYVVSWEAAPEASWGRPIAAMRCALIAGADAADTAVRALDAGVLAADGPIAAYCATLALLALRRDDEAAALAATLVARADFAPAAVATGLAALSAHDAEAYDEAAAGVLRSFEERDAFLEDVPVADTVLVLDALARERGLEVPARSSPLLPSEERRQPMRGN